LCFEFVIALNFFLVLQRNTMNVIYKLQRGDEHGNKTPHESRRQKNHLEAMARRQFS